jgi:hypothetical protein
MPEYLTPDVERELAALDDALAGRRVAPDLAELGELALLLRDDRPQPGPAFRPELDQKVARGFRDPEPRRHAQGRRWRAWLMPAMGATAAVLLVAVIAIKATSGPDGAIPTSSGGGQTASGGGSESSSSAPQDAKSQEDGSNGATAAARDSAASAAPFAEPAPPAGVAPAPGDGSPGSDGRSNRKVERSASLTLAARPRDIDTVSAQIQDVTRQQRGFVVSSTVSSSSGGGGGSFELRIPTRNLDAAMAALSRLGKVRERAQRSQDITAQAVSARSRLTDAKTERKSLLVQLGDAVTVAQTESIRARLKLVSSEIEQARAAVRRVSNRAAFSTVSVTLLADASAVVPGTEGDNWTPADAARDAVRVLEVAAGIGLIVLALGVPLALLAVLAAVAARWTRRRRREHALDVV